MRSPIAARLSLSTLLLFSCSTQDKDQSLFRYSDDGEWAQALIGASNYESSQVTFGTQPTPSSSELGTLPAFGAAGYMPFTRPAFLRFGGEFGLLLTAEVQRTVTQIQQGTFLVDVESRLIVADLFGGLYASAHPAPDWRLYLGAGPTLVGGFLYSDADGDSGWDNDLTLGAYARTGIEYRFAPQTWVGLGVRWTRADLEFKDLPASYDLEGLQALLTFSFRP